MLFALRKLIVTLLAPSLWGFVALAVGCALLLVAWRRDRGRRAGAWGRWLVVAGSTWLLLLSLGVPFDSAGRWLEDRHAPLLTPAVEAAGVEWVVVLGGGHRADARLPVSAHLPEAALYRVIEGVRVHRELPDSRLVFLGFGGEGRASAAEVGASLALALGVEADRVVVEGSPRTTAEEAQAVRQLVGDDRVVLVTSATHMWRSMRLFEGAGLSAIPAPTGHGAPGKSGWRDWLVPAPHRLHYADAVAHELFGMLAAQAGGR